MVSLRSQCKKRTRIGLDVGGHAVRAVQLRRSGNVYTVSGSAQHERRPIGTDQDRPIGDIVRVCLQSSGCRGKLVETALSSPDLEVHAIKLPPAVSGGRRDELDEIVHWEVQRLTTLPSGSVETRHWLLPETRGSAPNALGVAAAREVITQSIEACAAAGFTCSGVDAAAAALSRFGSLLNPWPSDAVWGILDLGLRETRTILCVDGVPVLVRTTGPGGEAWTAQIAEALEISVKAAEVQKRDAGLALTGRGVRAEGVATPAGELAAILTGVLRNDLQTLAGEVKRSYEYVLSCYPRRRAADLVLVGGGAVTKNLAEYLAQALGIPVCPASAWLSRDGCRLRFASGRQSRIEELALAVGVAIES